MRRCLLFLTLVLVLMFLTLPALGVTPSIIIDGQQQHYDAAPVVAAGHTLVPLRGIFESLGATVKWDPNTRSVTAAKGSTVITLTVGKNVAKVGSQNVKLEVPAKVINGRTMVPLRFVGEALGAEVKWDGGTGTIKIASNKDSQDNKGVADCLALGSKYYLIQDYEKAANFYSKALEMEKQKRTLDQNQWRVLVDNLGMAYGISGNITKSIEVFEYGLGQDSTYPMFYYNLACCYAAQNNKEKTLINLTEAFKYKNNMIQGEIMPDPRTDSSFEEFIRDDLFREALNKIMSAD